MNAAGDDFARVLAEAGESAPGPRPPGWEGTRALAALREGTAVLAARQAARWAAHAGERQAARDLYERARRQAGGEAGAPLPPWLGDGAPPFRIL